MKIKCPQCFESFEENSEKYYWHLKIHNAELERGLLNKQWNKTLEKEM